MFTRCLFSLIHKYFQLFMSVITLCIHTVCRRQKDSVLLILNLVPFSLIPLSAVSLIQLTVAKENITNRCDHAYDEVLQFL